MQHLFPELRRSTLDSGLPGASGWSVAGTFSAVAGCAGAELAVGRDCIALDELTLEIAMDAMLAPLIQAQHPFMRVAARWAHSGAA